LPSVLSLATIFHSLQHTPRGCSAAKAVDEIRAQLPEFRTELPGLRVLHLDPLVLTFDDFFTEDMCDEYVAKALTGEASQLASPTFSQATAAARTSTTWFLRYAEAAELVGRACALTGAALQRWEEPQLVRYRPGESFAWHYDAVPPTQLRNGGQRCMTLLVYLRSAGGATVFRDLHAGGTDDTGSPLKLSVTPKKGQALLFFPSDAEGVPDERTLHAGAPADSEKWIAQMWLHEREYTPAVPRGNSHEGASEMVEQLVSSKPFG